MAQEMSLKINTQNLGLGGLCTQSTFFSIVSLSWCIIFSSERGAAERASQAKKRGGGREGKARRSSFILPPSPYSYNNTLRSCYNGGSLRSCSQPRPRPSIRPSARATACLPAPSPPAPPPSPLSTVYSIAHCRGAAATHPWPLPYPTQPAFSSRVPEPEIRSQDAVLAISNMV